MSYAVTLDVRDLAKEWQELLDDIAAYEDDDDFPEATAAMVEELEPYKELADELGCSTPDELESFGNGYEPTLILASTFEEYAQELAEEIGALPESNQWPAYCIDWAYAARELAYDYTTITYRGDDYYIRTW